MSMMTWQILKFGDLPKTQKSKNLDNEALLFKFIHYTKVYNMVNNSFLPEVTFNYLTRIFPFMVLTFPFIIFSFKDVDAGNVTETKPRKCLGYSSLEMLIAHPFYIQMLMFCTLHLFKFWLERCYMMVYPRFSIV